MTAVADALERFRRQPSLPEDVVDPNGFRLVSTVDGPADGGIDEAWNVDELPSEVAELWTACGGARLFRDIDYGQWGLALLSPVASAERTSQERAARPSDVRSDDIVLGTFLGDSELLMFAPSEAGRRRVLIALPLDDRADWYGVAADLGSFLDTYFESHGTKYWEP